MSAADLITSAPEPRADPPFADDAHRHLRAADPLRVHLPHPARRHGDDVAEAARRGHRRQHVRAAAAPDLRRPGSRPGARRASASPTRAGINGYFWNSIKMVVPAVLISTLLGALNGYVLTKWRFPGHKLVFGMMLFACFIPFQSVIIPMAVILGKLGAYRQSADGPDRLFVRLRQSDRQSGHRPRRLRPRLHDAVLPQLLRGVPDRTGQGGA